MSDAFYHKGLAIEFDPSIPRLTIDGRVLPDDEVNEILASSLEAGEKTETLRQAAEKFIDESLLYKKREKDQQHHIAELRKGVKSWNQWRLDHLDIRPLLYELNCEKDLGYKDLTGVDFSNANLIQSDFTSSDPKGTKLEKANFHEANMGGADFRNADLTSANFCRADLYETNLSQANLHKANLQGAQLAKTKLVEAKLVECKVYGMAAWDLELEGSEQEDLIIRYRSRGETKNDEKNPEAEITLDDLEVAQFIYLLLSSPKMRKAIDKITSKVVLILGSFKKERMPILEAIKGELRDRKYVPALFNFPKPENRDLTDTVKLLAQMSRFIIIDLTDPHCTPYELQNVYDVTNIPIQCIILKGHQPFKMFWNLRNKRPDRVLIPVSYRDIVDLKESFDERVISPLLAAQAVLKEGSDNSDKEEADWEKKNEIDRD